jgi:hypothetical protein
MRHIFGVSLDSIDGLLDNGPSPDLPSFLGLEGGRSMELCWIFYTG